jgi:hypothetical protein
MEPPPSPGNGREITRADLDRWSKIYRTAHRQLRRWIARGIECRDVCPLDTPAAMPAWWARCMKHLVPAKIMTAAQSVAGEKSSAPSAHGNSDQSSSSPSTTSTAGADGTPIDFDSLPPEESGSALADMRRLRAAQKIQLAEAYRLGRPTEMILSRYLKTGTAIRALEKDEREDEVAAGRFLRRDLIERDAALFADMLRQMRESMERRVLELCPSLGKKQRSEVGAAIRRVCDQQNRIFTRLPSLGSPDDFLAELAA